MAKDRRRRYLALSLATVARAATLRERELENLDQVTGPLRLVGHLPVVVVPPIQRSRLLVPR
ncbi:MAG: hypothetical protein KDA59_03115, partial [Planctomycetales bacterium]|nr:hypothetical protein [Planctomycetales bacterium]